MRQKSKMRNWMAKALCAVMLTVQMFPNGLVVRAASQENQSATQEVVTTTPEVIENPVIHKKTVAIYYVLNRGQVLPLYNDTLDYYHWSKLPSYGFTDKQTNIENNVKAVEDSIISIPEGGDSLLKEGEEIRWFAMKDNNYQVFVYGMICPKGDTSQMDPVIDAKDPNSYENYYTYYTSFYLLQEGESIPTSLEDVGNHKWSKMVDPAWGIKTSTKLRKSADEKEIQSYIIKAPNNKQMRVAEDKEIHWAFMKPSLGGNHVYGYVTDKEAVTAVATKAPTTVPTKAPTAVPTVAPTAVPTVAPTVAPAVQMKKTVAIYYVLNRGQVLPLYNDTLDYYHWSKLPSYGFTDKQTNIENNVKAVEDSIISVPEGGDALLKEGEEIRWFAMKDNNYQVFVYGMICPKGDTSQMDPVIDAKDPSSYENYYTYYTSFYVLQEGESIPTSLEDVGNHKWSKMVDPAWGIKTSTKLRKSADEKEIQSYIIKAPNNKQMRVAEDKEIHWAFMKPSLGGNHVYGYVTDKEAVTAVPTKAPTAVPTKAPTAVPTKAPTAVPTKAPTAVPTKAPTAVPTKAPTAVPTVAPTAVPTVAPIAVLPVGNGYEEPSVLPTYNPSIHKEKYANFFILQKGQSTPQYMEALDYYRWHGCYGGAVWTDPSNDVGIFDDMALVESRIRKVPAKVAEILEEDEEVHWFAIKPNGTRESLVYGVVCKKGMQVDSLENVDPIIDASNPLSYNNYTKYYTRYYISDDLGLEAPKTLADLSNYKWNTTPNYNMRSGYSTKLRRVVGEENVLPLLISGAPTASELALQKDEDIHWVAMNTNNTTCYVYGIIYNKNVEASILAGAKESKETEIVVDTIEDLKNLQDVYPAGAKIYTKGYYEAGDGGAATYEVAYRSSGGYFSSLTTKTGQHVNFVIENKTINLLQFGAGRCKAMIDNVTNLTDNDDAARLNEAIGLIDKYDDGVIEIPEGELRCASKVYIGGDHYKIVGKGKTSILYTDNGYQGDEHFLTVVGKDITLDNFRVEARETKWVPYYRQCSVMFASDIQILNCEFSVKKNVIAFNGNTDRQYTNITLYTDWHNVKIDNCFMEQMGCVERGACLGIIDMWSAGCSDVSVTNCTMLQNAHDEMLGIFTKTGAAAGISNINISNNKMYTASASNVSKKTMAITIAYDESREINNVRFTNNVVEADVPSNFMTFGKLSDCVIADNEFIVHHTTNYTSGVIFDARPGVTVKDNHITVTSKENGGLSQIFKRGGIFENNIVDCDCYVYAMSYLESIVRNNTIHIKGGCKTLGLDITEMSGNDITVDGYMETYIHFTKINTDCLVTQNTFHYNYDDHGMDYFPNGNGNVIYAGFHAGINGHTVEFSYNTIDAPNVSSKNKAILLYGVGGNEEHFIIKNNKVGVYRWIREIYDQSLAKVEVADNYDKDNKYVDYKTNVVMYDRTTLE